MDLSSLHDKIGKSFYHLGQLQDWEVGEAFEVQSFEVFADKITIHGTVNDGYTEIDSRDFYANFGLLSDVAKVKQDEKERKDFEDDLRTDPQYR